MIGGGATSAHRTRFAVAYKPTGTLDQPKQPLTQLRIRCNECGHGIAIVVQIERCRAQGLRMGHAGERQGQINTLAGKYNSTKRSPEANEAVFSCLNAAHQESKRFGKDRGPSRSQV
jgi:hypothetical protein